MSTKDLEMSKPIEQVKDLQDYSSGSVAPAEPIDRAVEKRAIMKMDIVVLGCFGFMYFLSTLDRNNLGNTLIMGLPEDLNLVGNQFGNAVSILFATYVPFETPYALLLKKVGTKYLMTACMLCWGCVCLGMAFVKTANQLYACRLLMGFFEASVIPCINAYIGMVYLRSEMSVRTAAYTAFGACAGAFGGLLAFGASNIQTKSLNSWSWLFIIEASITIAYVPIMFCLFPNDPRNAWFLNEDEKAVMKLRYELNPHLSLDEKFSWAAVLEAAKDPKTYLHAVLQFSVDVSLFGLTTFLPAIIRGMGYSGVHAQLLTVPIYVWGTIIYFGFAVLSDRTGLRSPFVFVGLLLLIIGYAILLGVDSVAGRYIGTFILIGGLYPATGITIVWLNSNFSGYYKRTTAVGTTFTIGNVAGAVVGQIYTAQSQPRYYPGIRIAIGFTCFSILLTAILTWGLHWANKRRQHKIDSQGPPSIEQLREAQRNDRSLYFKYNL